MDRIETPGFSVETGSFYQSVVSFAGSVAFKCQPETMFSPQMTIWTGDPQKGVSPEDWLTDALEESGPISRRHAVSFAGMSGELARVDDKLQDYETGEKRDWRRLRVVLTVLDGSAWIHATAMSSGEDLHTVEVELARALNSLVIKATEEAARSARNAYDQELEALAIRLAQANRKSADELEARTDDARNAATFQSIDVEASFDKVINSLDLADKRDALRTLAMPTLSLTEAGESPTDLLGTSRVGGGPDLAEGMAWPRDNSGFHLNFLAQIDLADLPKRFWDVPVDGLLSFFCGTDYSDGTVIYTPAASALKAHPLPADAEETAIQGMGMVEWDGSVGRFVPADTDEDDISIETDATGRLTFLQDAKPVIVLASEYEISRSQQALRFTSSLSMPFGMLGRAPQSYRDIGLDDPSDFCLTLQDAFTLGDGPQHQMFGVTGIRDLAMLQEAAARYAVDQVWAGSQASDDWFILLKLASGGETGFSFSDHGDFVFMASRQDTRRADFSRIYAFVESG